MGKYSLLAGRLVKTKKRISNNNWGAPVGPPKICYNNLYIDNPETLKKVPPKK